MRLKNFILLLVMLSFNCFSHPHSFITLETDFVTEHDNLVSIKFIWTMDEMTSSYLKYEYQHDPKSVFNQFMINIFENHFFSEFWLKTLSKPKAILLKPQEKGAKLDLDGPKAKVFFEAKLREPINVIGNEFELMTYEKTFYVDMYYESENKIHINHNNCKITLTKPSPTEDMLNYANELDLDDSPMETDDFILGKLFSQKVTIKCH